MRHIVPALLLTSFTLIAGSALAQSPDYAGQYRLADGRVLTVSDNDGKLTAQIVRPAITQQNRAATARNIVLTEVGPGRFKAHNLPLQITFGQGVTGAIADVSLDEQAPLTIAQR